MKQESAEQIALASLGWLAGEDEIFMTFLGATGASVEDVRARAGQPEFLAGVLEFILMNDEWVVACCAAQGIGNDRLAIAHQVLPGGALPNWT